MTDGKHDGGKVETSISETDNTGKDGKATGPNGDDDGKEGGKATGPNGDSKMDVSKSESNSTNPATGDSKADPDDGYSTSTKSSSSPVQHSPKELAHIQKQAAAATSEDGSLATGHKINYGNTDTNGSKTPQSSVSEELGGSATLGYSIRDSLILGSIISTLLMLNL